MSVSNEATGMLVHVSEESLVRANAQFWEQMLLMSMETVSDAEKYCVEVGHMRASVGLSGSWNGKIEICLGQSLAQVATAAMLMQPVEEVTKADTLDAIGEIANMIGGVIKSSLPRPCTMTLPQSTIADQPQCNGPRTEATLTVAFRHDAGGLVIKVWENSQAD